MNLEVASNCITFIQSFVNICHPVSEFNGEEKQRHTQAEYLPKNGKVFKRTKNIFHYDN
jgi:hypothetical protein